ncbi:TspO/MBR family protein [Lutibacter sp.]|uniref:TspO/MBR family protein n=1 Tax=Lutibacter sp. TaxID=1925666 RepID=UPI001A210D36|nr:TspO/MBR family protein [Lutibacter sp.]MBI9042396.1 tryptophan-rich sensory protein [Lutibacter sp.]
MYNYKLLVLFLILNFGALAVGSWLMDKGPTTSWYLNLNRAPWSPPGWAFGVAWTTIMLCFSFYMTSLIGVKPVTFVWVLFFIQFVLNISWNYFFFNLHMMGVGLLILVSLTIVVGYFLFNYYSVMGKKVWLIAPYFVWLLIANSLNAYAFFKN